MQESRVTRNMTYWREEKPKNYDWLLMLIVLVLIIVGALV